jgi:uncharacterized protein (TIGR03435 family)
MRTLRVGLSIALGFIVVIAALTAGILKTHSPASQHWVEFSIGPPSGESSWVSDNLVRADGITLKGIVATAYDIPAVRVIAPEWMADTRYSINAVVRDEASKLFRPLLQEELTRRLRLKTHLEVRPFEVFVLTAAAMPRVERARVQGTNISISRTGARLQDASMEDLASALQSILRKPVIDETGLTGTYNLEFDWSDDRIASVTATLRDRFGLQLSAGSRDLPVLIVDGARREVSLVLLSQIGRLARAAPEQWRRDIANTLTIR